MGRINNYPEAFPSSISDDDMVAIDGDVNGTRSLKVKDFFNSALNGPVSNSASSPKITDLNDAINPGMYYFASDGANVDNIPNNSVKNGWLQVITAMSGNAVTRVKQIFYRVGTMSGVYRNDFQTFVRTGALSNSVWSWSDWFNITSTDPVRDARYSIVINPESGGTVSTIDFNDSSFLTSGLRYFLTPKNPSGNHLNCPYGVQNGFLETLTAGNHEESIIQRIYPKTDYSGLFYERVINKSTTDGWVTVNTTFHQWTPSNRVSVASNLLESYAVKTIIDRSKIKPVNKFTKVLFLGDSITAGTYSDIDPSNTNYDKSVSASNYGWVDRFKELTGCQVTNNAVPGAMFSSAGNSGSDLDENRPYKYMLLTQYLSLIYDPETHTVRSNIYDKNNPLNPKEFASDYDLIIVSIGTNDAGFNSSTAEIKYELKRLLDWISETSGSSPPGVIFITPIRRIQQSKPLKTSSNPRNTTEMRLIDFSTPQNRRIAEISSIISNAALHAGHSVINGFDIPLVMGTVLGKSEDVLIPDTSYRPSGSYYNTAHPKDVTGDTDSSVTLNINYENDPAKAMSSDTIHPSIDGHKVYAQYIKYIINSEDYNDMIVGDIENRDSRNLNDYTDSGVWYFTRNENPLNPDANFPPVLNGWLEVHKGSGHAVKQIFYRTGTTSGASRNDFQTFVRTRDPSTGEWSDWFDITLTDVDPTLRETGKAADAAATGAALYRLKSRSLNIPAAFTCWNVGGDGYSSTNPASPSDMPVNSWCYANGLTMAGFNPDPPNNIFTLDNAMYWFVCLGNTIAVNPATDPAIRQYFIWNTNGNEFYQGRTKNSGQTIVWTNRSYLDLGDAIRAISPFDLSTDENGSNKAINANGSITDNGAYDYSKLIRVEKDTEYILTFMAGSHTSYPTRIIGYNSEEAYIRQIYYQNQTANIKNIIRFSTTNETYIRISHPKQSKDMLLYSSIPQIIYNNKNVPEVAPIKSFGYKGAKVSILGASISTFNGYIPEGYSVYYPHTTSNPNPVLDVNDTYWMKFIDAIGGELLVNNSSAGSYCSTGHGSADSLAGCGNRCEELDNGTDMPDIIIIQLGGNDFTRSTPLGTYDGTQVFPTDTTTFREAYAVMLNKITTKYKKAKVICGTIPIITGGGYVTRTFPAKNLEQSASKPGGILLEEYNRAIRELAALFGCKVVEFSKCGITYNNVSVYMQDYIEVSNYGQHPNRFGHSLMANELLRTIGESGFKKY